MSFADELRGINAQKQAQDQANAAARAAQAEKSWPIIVELFYRDLKGHCVLRAQSGESSWSIVFFDFICSFVSQRTLLDASGTAFRPTQEEATLLLNVHDWLCQYDRLPERYAKNLVTQISARFQAEGLSVEAQPVFPDTNFPDVRFHIRW